MFHLLPFITLITFFKCIYSIKDDYISNCHYNLKTFQNYTLSTTSESNETNCDCLPSDFTNITNNNLTQIVICALKCWKNNSTKFIDFANNIRGIIHIFDNFNLTKLGKLVLNITKNYIYNDSIILQIANIMNTTNFTDLIIELINWPKESKDSIDYYRVYFFLHRLAMIKGFFNLFQSIYNSSRTDLLDFIQEFLNVYYSEKLASTLALIRAKMGKYMDDVVVFIYQIFMNFNDRKKILEKIQEFLNAHNNSYDKIKEIMMEEQMRNLLDTLIYVNDTIMLNIKNIIIWNKEFMGQFFDILRNNKSLNLSIDLLKNINNMSYLKENVGKLASNIYEVNSYIIDNVTEFFFALIFNISKKNDNIAFITASSFQNFLKSIITDLNYDKYNISPDCTELFYYTYFDKSLNNKKLFYFYFQKFLFDSSRNKGNFLSFDNCLDNSLKFDSLQYNISPTYVIGIINEEEEKKNYKNSSFYFKFKFLKGYCFPFGYKNETKIKENIPMCSETDYEKMFRVLYHIYSDKNNISISTFYINNNNKSPNAKEIIFGILGILFLALPLLIYVFLLISGRIIANKQKKVNEIDENIKNLKINTNKFIEVNNNTNAKKIIFPFWYQYLNECFNIKNNIKELFNFTLDETNYNNFKGMTYIKGVIGICIILTVFGQVFLSLLNLPNKNYGIWDYYLLMSNILYPILFIGYRYCPRILFSCSGYSLIYKYLCYIEQEKGLYFLKFMFLQSYKYLLLIFSIIFIRFALYYVVFLITYVKRPVWEIFHHFISNEENFIQEFFFFYFYSDKNNSSRKQNLIFHFYIPINEVFFFIFGTILISLGYKFKLRIDIIILVLILLLYLVKIILYIIFRNDENKVYTTTDYYLFDYGLTINQPLFNMNYFLIGMFFGLINYSIQKGITDLEEKNNYQNIYLLPDSKNITDEEENKAIRNKSVFSMKDMNNNKNELNINKDSNNYKIFSKKSKKNQNLSKSFETSGKKKKNKNKRAKDINDINEDNNKNLEKFILEEKEANLKSIEYSEEIKQMPFLIWPVKFSNFHKSNKDKLIFILIIIFAFILIIFFITSQIIFTTKLKTKYNDKNIVEELSFKKIIPEIALNILYLLDIEVAVFIIQWINLILYFKEVGIIRTFLNHAYWSFFVKSYFSFIIISTTVIFCVFYINENAIKFNLSNIFLYTFIDIIFILLFTIAVYCCFELPLKKVFKIFLIGKEALNNEIDEDEYEEDENNKNEEDKLLSEK